jgi:hypothetical protein
MCKGKIEKDTQEEVNDDMPKVMPGFVYKHFLHSDAKISKLATREDNYHIHKTLGILSVLSFCYRYGYVYLSQGNLGFDGSSSDRDPRMIVFDWITMAIHTLLALSSIIFRVPRKRISNKPMVIYEEYRQHAMVFTLRCFSVFAVTMLFPNQQAWLSPVVVMAHHLLADRITSIWGTPGNTAVRATSGSMKLSTFYMTVAKLYSLYQFLAIASHILPNERLGDMAYNAIIAIQSSAFMMTLYRKRIIRGRTHMVVYALCLYLSAFHIVRNLGLYGTLLTVVAFLIRINLPRAISNKYAIWFTFLCAFYSPYIYSTLIPALTEQITVLSGMDDYSIKTAAWTIAEKFPAVKGTAVAALLYGGFSMERLLLESVTAQPDIQRSDSEAKTLSDKKES